MWAARTAAATHVHGAAGAPYGPARRAHLIEHTVIEVGTVRLLAGVVERVLVHVAPRCTSSRVSSRSRRSTAAKSADMRRERGRIGAQQRTLEVAASGHAGQRSPVCAATASAAASAASGTSRGNGARGAAGQSRRAWRRRRCRVGVAAAGDARPQRRDTIPARWRGDRSGVTHRVRHPPRRARRARARRRT